MEGMHGGYYDGGASDTREPGILSTAELIAREAEDELMEMVRQNPDLIAYVSQANIRQAANLLTKLQRRLKQDPGYFEDVLNALRKRSADNPGARALYIDPLSPLVLTQSPEGLEGFIPVLGCTLQALHDLRGYLNGPNIVHSEGDYVLYAYEQMERNPDALIKYEHTPIEYVAMASASFTNETFRFRIQGDQLAS